MSRMDDTPSPPPRLTSAMLVSALIRRVQGAGGFAAVLHHGDDHAGAIMLDCVHRGRRLVMLERGSDSIGRDGWRSLPALAANDEQTVSDAIAKRRRFDPDLWLVELDIAEAERFAAEVIGTT